MKKDKEFIKKVIAHSMDMANSSSGNLRDIFISQALRLDLELEQIELEEEKEPKPPLKASDKKPKKTKKKPTKRKK